MTNNKIIISLTLILLLPLWVFSQRNKKEAYTFFAIPEVVVDGGLEEWPDNLYQADSEIWSAGISLQRDSIYAAIVIKDFALQREALLTGVIFNLSYNAKKRDGAQLLFPVADKESLRALRQEDEMDGDLRRALLNTSRGYYVSGFDRIVDGLLSLQNSYGIRASVKLDSAQLVYEAVIPLDLVAFKSDEIAVKLGVNTQFNRLQANRRNQSNRALGPYGIYAPRAPTPKNPYREPTEIWVIGKRK